MFYYPTLQVLCCSTRKPLQLQLTLSRQRPFFLNSFHCRNVLYFPLMTDYKLTLEGDLCILWLTHIIPKLLEKFLLTLRHTYIQL